MEELGAPGKLMDERMGHDDGSVQARYSHVTTEMRHRLLDGLTARWEAALAARERMNSRSPVSVLDRLLSGVPEMARKIFSQNSPRVAGRTNRGQSRNWESGL
jgi:hypothetical protein